MMKVQDFKSCEVAKTMHDLETILSKRYLNDENWFLLCFDGEQQPSMTIAIRGDLSTLHYMRSIEDAGFVSVGGILDPDEEIVFKMNVNNEFPILGDAVLPTSKAILAAKEFFNYKNLPKSVDWLEI